MLVVPITGKISWSNPPFVTIGIVLINCCVLFFLQANDNNLYNEAEEYYFASGLVKIEVPLYIKYLVEAGEVLDLVPDVEGLDMETLSKYHMEIEEDINFLTGLRNGNIISVDTSDFEAWKELRDTYESKVSKIVFMHYGFRPAYHRLPSFLTHMFLHDGFSHLLGNMIFLWLVGCVLEMGCGRLYYSITYIITGLGAVCLFWLVDSNSTMPLVGASGAISGLMGIFAVLYGRTKVKIFYSLGFYFGYIKIPALILFPLWVGNECYQLFWGGASQVAYVAHIGGLLSGAVAGYVYLKFFRFSDELVFVEESVDEISPLMEKALHYMGELDYKKARTVLERVLEKDPANFNALRHLFTVDKQNPELEQFHDTAKKMLVGLCRKNGSIENLYECYRDYTVLTKSTRLPSELYLNISRLFAESEHVDESLKIMKMLLQNKPDLPGMAAALLMIAKSCKNRNRINDAEMCFNIIFSKYPDSVEARIIKQS